MSSVDVIVPCYRYAHFLKECVESVLAQSGPSVRVLIIDDASPDNTGEVATELTYHEPRVTLLRHTSNKGHIATYNEGIDWVSADYLLLLSADDYLLPGALNRATTLMEGHPEVGFTFGNVVVLGEHGITGTTDNLACQNSECILVGAEFIALGGARNIVPTPTAVVRTELQKRIGGYRAELPHSGDMELWLRLAAHASVGFIEAPQAVYRRHTANMSLYYAAQSYLPDIQQRKAALDSFFGTCSYVLPNPTRLRARLLYKLSMDAVGLASTAFNSGELKSAEQISEFALHISPNVKRSRCWVKFALKRKMGLKAWQALRPAADCVRRLVYVVRNQITGMLRPILAVNESRNHLLKTREE